MAAIDDLTPAPIAPAHGLPDAIAEHLPERYLLALEGIAAGDDDHQLAARTGVDPAAVPGLIRLATAKLLQAQVAGRPALADPPAPDETRTHYAGGFAETSVRSGEATAAS